jgi:hypothetical protein
MTTIAKILAQKHQLIERLQFSLSPRKAAVHCD